MILPRRQVSSFGIPILFCISLLLAVSSCIVPKKYQANKPFVFKTKIEVKADLPATERQNLADRLQNQLDDSLKVRTVWAFRILPPFLYQRLSRPPVFDTANIARSRNFMNALLINLGYFYPRIRDTFRIDTLGDQQRVTINFVVTTGKQRKIDSVGFSLQPPELQNLTLANQEETLLKKNLPYSIPLVSGELDRLFLLFRNNGYYKITREDLYAEVDTVEAALIDPTLDPFEQVRLLEELRKKQENPTINITIRLRPFEDSTRMKKFYWGNIRVFPDLNLFEEPGIVARKDTLLNGIHVVYNTKKFRLPFIASNIKVKSGQLFRQNDYFRIVNTFNRLGAWQNVDLGLYERIDTLPLLDADLKLYPAKKQSLNIDLDASRNIGDFLTTGQLFGTGVNIKIGNRNAYRESIQTSTNGRFGVELGSQLIQTIQGNLSHTINFPRLITPFRIRNTDSLQITRTNLNINAAYTNRRDFYDVRSINTSWGYDWTRRRHSWQYTPFNFEYTNVQKKDSLVKLETEIPSLAYAFNNGLIISQIFGYNTVIPYKNKISLFRVRLEESGGLFGLIQRLERGELRRFLKLEGEFNHFINYKKSSWAFRFYAGYGYVYGKTGNQPEYTLPFFKAFFSGGPYGMRAWQVRQLGPGTALLYDTTGGRSTDRFGNVKLESNVEYRFNLATIAGIKLSSALFVDIGNIWSREFDKNTGNSIPEAEFRFSKLYKDIAVGGGTGLRFDFDFFLIRLDWAYKLKNPQYADSNKGWFQKLDLGSGQFQLGIGYPF